MLFVATLVAAAVSFGSIAQEGEGPPRANAPRGQAAPGAGPGGQAARAPTAEEIAQLPEERRTPAEQQTAHAKNPNWKAPRTS